jgi:hypothetical protein
MRKPHQGDCPFDLSKDSSYTLSAPSPFKPGRGRTEILMRNEDKNRVEE